MNESTSGFFDYQQMNSIRDAHRDWCASQSIDVESPVGQEAAGIMFRAYKQGHTTRESLIEACDEEVQRQQKNVRLGAPAIPSRS